MIKYLFVNLKVDFLYYRRYLKFLSFLNKVVIALKSNTSNMQYEELYEAVSGKKYLIERRSSKGIFTVDVEREWYSKKLKVTFNSYIFDSNLTLALNYLQECGYIKNNFFSFEVGKEIKVALKLYEDSFKEISKDINNYIVVPNFKYYSY